MSHSAGHGRRAGRRAPPSPAVQSDGTPAGTPTTQSPFRDRGGGDRFGSGGTGGRIGPSTDSAAASAVAPPFGGTGTAATSSIGNPFGISADHSEATGTEFEAAAGGGGGRVGGRHHGNRLTNSSFGAADSEAGDSAPPPPHDQTVGGIASTSSVAAGSADPVADFFRFNAGGAGAGPISSTTSHSHHHRPGATGAGAAAAAGGLLLVQTSDAATETAELLSLDDEVSLVNNNIRAVQEQLAAAAERALAVESKMLLADDELRVKELAAQRAIDAATLELDRVRTSGKEYTDRKIQQLQDDQFLEGKKIYDELKGFHDERRSRLKQQLSEEKARLQKEVSDMTEKRDVLEAENGGANETRAIRKIQKAKTVPEKIAVATDIAMSLAEQLKKFVGENVRDLVRGETINAFDEIRRGTLEQRQNEKKQRADGMTQFQRDAVQRSQELLQARDEARQRRLREHQQLLERARNRATKSTTDSTQALLDQVAASHEEAMRKFKIEFDSQHDHVKEMHSLVSKDDRQLDEQKHREARQRFESHRKMARELLEADSQALAHSKERESAMWAENTPEADPNAGSAIAHSVMSAVVRGTADVQRRLSTVSSNVRAQVAAMERQASTRRVLQAASAGGDAATGSGDEHLEDRAALGEIKKMLASAMDRRLENHKKLEQGVSQFVSVVEKCGSVAQVQRNEVKATSAHAMSAQQQWDAELRRMMSDFSVVAATKQHRSRNNGSGGSEPPVETAATTATTPVGFLLSTVNDYTERLSHQLKTVNDRVLRPVGAQRNLLAAASREDAERQNAHSSVNAKVMNIFHMFESADAAMDNIRQREDEVRVEEISLAAQQRQLAEERRAFSVKCESMRKAIDQTERETQGAQTRERDARRELADSERQLAALAIEQRTLVARAAADTGGAVGMSSVRASTFVDPMSGMSPASSDGAAAGYHHHHHHHHYQAAAAAAGRGAASVPFADRTNHVSGNGGGTKPQPQQQQPQFHSQNPTNSHGGFTTGEDMQSFDAVSSSGGYSSGENLRRMKAKFAASASASAMAGQQQQQQTATSSYGSPGGNQADVSGGGDSSTASRFSRVYGVPPVRGAGMSAMAAAVSPPATASRTTTSSTR